LGVDFAAVTQAREVKRRAYARMTLAEPTDGDFEAKVREVTGDRRRRLLVAIDAVLQESEHGTWAGGQQVDATSVDGVEQRTFHLPYVEYSAAVDSLIETLYQTELIVPFDWMAWMAWKSPGGPGGEGNAALSLADAVRTITVSVRGERFGDGVLLAALQDGTLTRALERLKASYDDGSLAG